MHPAMSHKIPKGMGGPETMIFSSGAILLKIYLMLPFGKMHPALTHKNPEMDRMSRNTYFQFRSPSKNMPNARFRKKMHLRPDP